MYLIEAVAGFLVAEPAGAVASAMQATDRNVVRGASAVLLATLLAVARLAACLPEIPLAAEVAVGETALESRQPARPLYSARRPLYSRPQLSSTPPHLGNLSAAVIGLALVLDLAGYPEAVCPLQGAALKHAAAAHQTAVTIDLHVVVDLPDEDFVALVVFLA